MYVHEQKAIEKVTLFERPPTTKGAANTHISLLRTRELFAH